jgi:Fur family ferric uptake transcriptional regulator
MQRQTKTKQLVHSIISVSHSPLGLDELYDRVRDMYPKTAFSTVYRIVTGLEKKGMIAKVDFRDRGSKYEWAGREHHHHITCDRCGEVEDVKDTLMGLRVKDVAQKTGYALTAHTIELSGLCPNCQPKS